MPRYALVLTALLAVAAQAGAQGAPPAAGPSPAEKAAALDKYLLRWEQEMTKVKTLAAEVTRIDKDRTFDTTQKKVGFAQYLKAGTGATALNLGLLELKHDGKGEVAEKYVCTGTYLYQFVPAQKEIRAYQVPKPKSGEGDNNFLSFLFGMKADDAKKRYSLSLAKEDKYYIYVDILPRNASDRADFKRARLVLNKEGATAFLPRQLWFEHANGNEVTWDIPRLQSGVSLDRRNFDAPKPPPGWKLVTVPKPTAPPPSVVRPKR
jgi:TIGR03009 family protein